MAELKAHAIYDFEGQATGELSISAGEVLTILNKDVGDGWWEGCNSRGETGFFPATYVEEITSVPPAIPPPPLPAGYGNNAWSSSNQPPAASSYPPATQPSQYGGWDDDDEWDDDDDDASSISHNNANNAHPRGSFQTLPVSDVSVVRSNSAGDVSTMGRDPANKATIRRNFNRFTTFVKSGGEDYIIGKNKLTPPAAGAVEIVEAGNGLIMWMPNPSPHVCEITSTKKESKLRGFKSYIAYQIKSTGSVNAVVHRRYKQFDWLHQRLQEKFAVIPIPPLPDKQIAGRYEDAFIEHRKVMLQKWVNRITRHPVISQSTVWRHFITCTDEKDWKSGKRAAEKDEHVGAYFFYSVSAPPGLSEPPTIAELRIDNFGKFVKTMDDGVRNLQAVATEQIKKHTGAYKRDMQRFGNSFRSCSMAFDSDKHAFMDCQNLVAAIRFTGETYEVIGQLYEEQPKHDLEPLIDVLHEYKGMLSEFPDIFQVHKGALQKSRELQKISPEMPEIDQRMSLISYSTLAEMNHFKDVIKVDYNEMMKDFLKAQIQFYENVVLRLRESLSKYE